MLLLRRLIRNKQNTVMTNAQIIDILQSEFGISVNSSHELEVDIYIKIIKKYLKDWPQWEELERISTKLYNIKDFEAVSKVLNHKYKNLKEYLGVMLEAAKPLAKEAVASLGNENSKAEDNIDSSDVVMEIQCTREQLNHLFFRHPRLDLNNTVFNMSKVEPSRISLKALSLTDILNASWTKTNINLPFFTFTREVIYKLKHTLVNKVCNEKSSQDICLDTNLQMNIIQSKKSQIIEKKTVLKQFDDILAQYIVQSYDLYIILQQVFNIFKKDLEDSPDTLKIPGNYRKYANKYKYVRYLYAENEQSEDLRYDLQLEETISPKYQYYIGKVCQLQKPVAPIKEWFKIECTLCKFKFTASVHLQGMIETHFNELHQNEPDWQCTHCKRLFSMDYLSNNRWSHEC